MMATDLRGPHFLLNRDKFHRFHILKSETDCRAYLGSELTAPCFGQQPRLCTPCMRSRGQQEGSLPALPLPAVL